MASLSSLALPLPLPFSWRFAHLPGAGSLRSSVLARTATIAEWRNEKKEEKIATSRIWQPGRGRCRSCHCFYLSRPRFNLGILLYICICIYIYLYIFIYLFIYSMLAIIRPVSVPAAHSHLALASHSSSATFRSVSFFMLMGKKPQKVFFYRT